MSPHQQAKSKLQERLDIQALTVRYANALDRGDIDAWLETWAEDGIWEGAVGRYNGKAELAKLPIDLGERLHNKRHVMSNFVITADLTEQNQMHQQCYMLIFDQGSAAVLTATGVYDDIVKKIDGQWKFAQRKLELNLKVLPQS